MRTLPRPLAACGVISSLTLPICEMGHSSLQFDFSTIESLNFLENLSTSVKNLAKEGKEDWAEGGPT